MTNSPQTSCAERRVQACTELVCSPGQVALPVWRASLRMVLVCAVGVAAAGLIATGYAPEPAPAAQEDSKIIAISARPASAYGLFDQ